MNIKKALLVAFTLATMIWLTAATHASWFGTGSFVASGEVAPLSNEVVNFIKAFTATIVVLAPFLLYKYFWNRILNFLEGIFRGR